MTVYFSNASLDDIARIRAYGELQFGSGVAVQYQAKLQRAVALIEQYPEAERIREEYRTQPRLHFFGAHVIVYRIVPNGVEIIRFLGNRQNLHDVI